MPTIAQVQAVLGEGATVLSAERLEPWSVLRCVARIGGQRRNIVVKWLRNGTADTRTDPQQVRTERAALEFLAELGFARSPRLLGFDVDVNLLVLEDLAPRVPLNRFIVEHGLTQAEQPLRAFARTIGEMHALTAGAAAAAQLPPAGWPLPMQDWERTRRRLGCAMSAAAEAEWSASLRTLTEPGPFRALSNGDPQTNNFLTDGRDGVLIDFEFACFRHVALDAAWMYVPGPAWMRVDCPLALEGEYRTALAPGIPEAADDRAFGFGLGAGCAVSAVLRLLRFEKLDARNPGDRGRLQMVSTVESAAEEMRRRRVLPHLSTWLMRIGQSLRGRWPDADVDLATIPSYTARG